MTAKRPPRRLRPASDVFPHRGRRTAGDRAADAGAGFVDWILDPFGSLGDAFVGPFRGPERRRQEKWLKGGWSSTAGELAARLSIRGRRVLASGAEGLALVYVGRYGTEVAWQCPSSAVKDIELAHWVRPDDVAGGMVRIHFRDGSWVDVQFPGSSWRAVTGAA
ncbi:hypothetical protein [Streptomyces fractus]|uniref:hypothetical protein n=1 Tax=Streptomyces fractus TaxID=641806 RepID=UPI003CEAED8A